MLRFFSRNIAIAMQIYTSRKRYSFPACILLVLLDLSYVSVLLALGYNVEDNSNQKHAALDYILPGVRESKN